MMLVVNIVIILILGYSLSYEAIIKLTGKIIKM